MSDNRLKSKRGKPVDFSDPKDRARYHACERKGKFASERAALKVAAEPTNPRPGLVLSAYRCRHCKQWHLTSARQHDAPDASAFEVIPESK